MENNTLANNETDYPLITIVINNFNNARFIEKTINSAIKQTYKNLEILIVDDCSTQKKVFKIYEKYLNLDKRIKLIKHEKNSGILNSRFAGIRNAKGQYLSFLDGDDYYDLDFIRHMYCLIKAKKADIAMCNIAYCIENTTFVEQRSNLYKTEFNGTREIFNSLFFTHGYSYLYNLNWNKLIKTDLLRKALDEMSTLEIDFKIIFAGEDILLQSFLSLFCAKMIVDNNFIGNYYRRGHPLESWSLKRKKNYLKHQLIVYDIIHQFFFVKNKELLDEQNHINFVKTIIVTYKQYLLLLSLNVDELELDKITEVCDLKNIENTKQKILEQNINNFFPIVFNYKNQINQLKQLIIKYDAVEFNLTNSLYQLPFIKESDYRFLVKNNYFNNENRFKNFAFLNHDLFDCLELALFLKKQIKIIYNKNIVDLDLFKNELKKKLFFFNNESDSLISFVQTNEKIIDDFATIKFNNSKNFKVNNPASTYYQLLFSKLINKKIIAENIKTKLRTIYALAYLITNHFSFHLIKKSTFNYNPNFFVSLFISYYASFFNNEQNYTNNLKKIITSFFNNNINLVCDGGEFLYITNEMKSYNELMQQKLQNLFNNFKNDKKLSEILINLFFENYKYCYESKLVFPYDFFIIDKKQNKKYEIRKEWLKEFVNYKTPKLLTNYDYKLSKVAFFKQICFLVSDPNIFNNEMFIFLRKHPKLFNFFWSLNYKKIKK